MHISQFSFTLLIIMKIVSIVLCDRQQKSNRKLNNAFFFSQIIINGENRTFLPSVSDIFSQSLITLPFID